MANTFDEQARDRFTKSLKFMEKAQSLLEDDLVYRSALADAVSSIKNMLQGYLLLRVAVTPASAVTQRWQEIAASNRMPDLIAACGEAGLDLRGLAVDIRRLNTDRNNRAHDDPQRHIDPDEAAHAVETARTLQRRIRDAVQGKQEARSLPQMAAQAVQVVRAATSGQLHAGGASAPARLSTSRAGAPVSPARSAHAAHAAATSPSTMEDAPEAPNGAAPTAVAERSPETSASALPVDSPSPSPVDALDDSGDGGDSDDSSGDLPAISPHRRRGRRGIRILLRVLVAAALLLVGIAAGIGVSVPVTTGHAPAWLSFATRLLPTPAPTAAATAAASPAPAVTTQPQVAGSLVIGAPVCAAGSSTFTLANTGAKPARWSVGSPDAASAVFASAPGVTGAPTLAGTLAPGAGLTLYAADPGASGAGAVYHIVVVAASGTAQLVAPAC